MPSVRLDLYLRRRNAVSEFVLNLDTSVSSIEQKSGLHRKDIYRTFARCIARHPDGRIYGFRGAIPFIRTKSYERTATVVKGAAGQGDGTSGAFELLLSQYPDLKRFLDIATKRRSQQAQGKYEVRQTARKIHKEFLKLCRELGITASEYPFNQDLLASRSLSAYIKKQSQQSFDIAATNAGADVNTRRWSTSLERVKPGVTRPFQAVEFDGHKIDLR